MVIRNSYELLDGSELKTQLGAPQRPVGVVTRLAALARRPRGKTSMLVRVTLGIYRLDNGTCGSNRDIDSDAKVIPNRTYMIVLPRYLCVSLHGNLRAV